MLKIINKNKKELFKILESNNSSKDNFSLNWLNLFKIIPCKKFKFVKTLTKSKEPFKRLNKEISKNLTVNDLQHEINIIKQEISELKHKNKNINPELIMLKVGQTDKKHTIKGGKDTALEVEAQLYSDNIT